jgi:hypothetical protein
MTSAAQRSLSVVAQSGSAQLALPSLLMMRRILVTGMSGTGKSSALERLQLLVRSSRSRSVGKTRSFWDLDVLHVRWDRLCARDVAGTSCRRRPRRRRWPIDGLVLMGAAATLRHCSPSESGPGSDADQPLPRRPKWAGAHSSAGGDAVPSRVRRLARARVLFRRAYVGCKPGYCTPRPPFFWVFGLRPTGGLLLRFLVLVGIGFLRWLVVAEWRRDTRAMCLRSREAPCSSCAVPERCWSRRVVGKICRNAHLDDLPPTHKTARTAL